MKRLVHPTGVIQNCHCTRAVSCLASILAAGALNAQTASSIGSNFNGTSISDSSYIWFNSHLTSVSYAGTAATAAQVQLYVRNAKVTFTSGATNYVIPIPDSEITFSQAASGASGSYTAGAWHLTYPKSTSGDPFISGLMWDVPSGGISGGTNPVTWSAEFSTNVGSISSLSWQWSAAVYTQAPSDPNSLDVRLVDGDGEQSGTPDEYACYVVGGARGGGGSNYTGSNSGTGTVTNLAIVPEPNVVLLGLLASLFLPRRYR